MTLCGMRAGFFSFRGRRKARRDWKEGEAGPYANLGKKMCAQPTGSFYRVTPNRTENESLWIMGQEKNERQPNHSTGSQRGSRAADTGQHPARRRKQALQKPSSSHQSPVTAGHHRFSLLRYFFASLLLLPLHWTFRGREREATDHDGSDQDTGGRRARKVCAFADRLSPRGRGAHGTLQL